MKSAKEWQQSPQVTSLNDFNANELDWIRAIQADALEAAALRCGGIAYLHHHEHNECEGRDAANECAAEVRKLKEQP